MNSKEALEYFKTRKGADGFCLLLMGKGNSQKIYEPYDIIEERIAAYEVAIQAIERMIGADDDM